MASGVNNTPISVPGLLNSGVNHLSSLPAELIGQICWSLHPEDIRSLIGTSHGLALITIGQSNANNRSELIIFIQEMICTLNSTEFNPPIEDNTRNDLVTSLENMTKSLDADFPNLVSFDKYLKLQLQDITDLFSILDESQMNPLEKISCPMFCPDFFTVLPIWKRINAANTIPNDYLRSEALEECSKALLNIGWVNKSLELANTILDDYFRSMALMHCSNALSDLARPDEALKVINTIPNDHLRLRALKEHCNVQCAHEKDKELLDIATSIDCRNSKYIDVFELIFSHFAQLGKTTEILSVTEHWNQSSVDNSLLSCVRILLEGKNIDGSLMVISTIHCDSIKAAALRLCFDFLFKNSETEKVLEIVSNLDLSRKEVRIAHTISFALERCVGILLEQNEYEYALEVTHSIPMLSYHLRALGNCAIEYQKLGNMECAVGIAQYAFAFVSPKELRPCDISLVCLWVSKIFFDAGDFPNANTAIEMITIQHLKTEALEYCSNVGID